MSIPDRARAAVRDRDPAALLRLLVADEGVAAAAALAPEGDGELEPATAALLIEAAALARPEQVWKFADRCFVRGGLPPDARLLCRLAQRGDRRGRLVIQRSVIGSALGTRTDLDAVYAGLGFSDAQRRDAYLEGVRAALARDDAAALEELARPAAAPAPPPGFELVDANTGVGKTSRVCRLRRVTDGAEFAWKIPVDDGSGTRGEMALAVERSGHWVRLGISEAPIEWGPERRSLLQPFVSGPTLEERMRDQGLPAGGAEREQLVALFLGLVQQGGYVSGLNTSNLVFDGARWQVIDSGNVHDLGAPRDAWPRQRKDLLRKWTRGAGERRRAAVLSFLDEVESRLDTADRPSSAARLVRRLRGLG